MSRTDFTVRVMQPSKDLSREQEANDAGCLVTSDTDTLLKLLHNYRPH